MEEEKLIEIFSRVHGTRPFAADAEIVPFGETNLLVSTDSFSEREDFLGRLEPEAMGRVMAYGAISDVLACGANPQFLVQAWNIDDAHDECFYERAAHGVQRVVEHYGARIIGGDIGVAKEWCWTATVVASSPSPIRRAASQQMEFDLYVTGHLGAANAAVFLGRPMPEPVFRQPVPGISLFATDTSGGLFDSLENIRRANPGIAIEVDAQSAIAPEIARSLPDGVEPGWALVGGVGEYELLFAVPHGERVNGAIKIGRGAFCGGCKAGISIVSRGRIGHMSAPPPDYRAIAPNCWLAATAQYWRELGVER